MNKRVSILLLFLTSMVAAMYPQHDGHSTIILTFIIKNSEGDAIGKAAVKSIDPSGNIRTFSFSDKGGNVTIKTVETDSIEVSSMGYQTLRKSANDLLRDKGKAIVLQESANNLKEIVVKAPPIKKKNDTIVYDAKAFMARGDVHLEDILKKMPGLSVAENGTVSYQGKTINKFYIEGKDLLGGGYGQATRNMPADAINSVEVFENHQPVRMLQGQQLSEKAALNIRLDKNKRARPFGEISAGAGGSPALWDSRLFLTQINEQVQCLVTAKANNSGTDISEDVAEKIDTGDPFAYELLPQEVFSRSMMQQNIPAGRYTNNNSQCMGINFLVTPTRKSALRGNVSFYHDRSSFDIESANIYGGIKDVSIFENRNMKQSQLTVMPQIKYELNDERHYISDEFKYSFTSRKNADAVKASFSDIEENTKSRPSFVQNYFRGIFPAAGKNFDIKSYLRYIDRNEMLRSHSDTISFYDIEEALSLRNLSFRNSASTSFASGIGSFGIGANINYRHSDYNYKGDMNRDELRVRVTPAYMFRNKGQWALSLGLPIEIMHASLNKRRGSVSKKDKILALPTVNYRLEVTPELRMTLTASMNADMQQRSFHSPYAIHTGYRSVLMPDSILNISKSQNSGIHLSYRNLVYLLFANASITYQKRRSDILDNYTYTDTTTVISTIEGKNNRESLDARISADKTFPDAGLTTGLRFSYNNSSYIISQSGILTRNHSAIYALDMDLDFHYLKWMRFTTELHGMIYRSKNERFGKSVRKSFKTDASLFIFPTESLELKGTANLYVNQITQSSYKQFGLIDFQTRYVISKRWDCQAKVSNMLNVKNYSISTDDAVNKSYTLLPLRGREFMISVGCRF